MNHLISNALQTYRGIAHPWLCDAFDHLNTRHYVAMFDDASFHFFSLLGFSYHSLAVDKRGWADVKAELEFKREVPRGELVVVYTGLVALGNKSLTYRHEMRNADDPECLHATMETVTAHFDLVTRKALPLPEGFRLKAEQYLIPSQ
ncbi:MAG: acyl-CoA thioesterase [Candidatus Competibacterales bacterium]